MMTSSSSSACVVGSSSSCKMHRLVLPHKTEYKLATFSHQHCLTSSNSQLPNTTEYSTESIHTWHIHIVPRSQHCPPCPCCPACLPFGCPRRTFICCLFMRDAELKSGRGTSTRSRLKSLSSSSSSARLRGPLEFSLSLSLPHA